MTSKHRIACIALSATVAFKLFAGTADAAVLNAGELAAKGRGLPTVLQASGPTGRPIVVTDISNPNAPVQLGRGVDIARVDGEIVNS